MSDKKESLKQMTQNIKGFKSWWSGDPRVGKYMTSVYAAIHRQDHVLTPEAMTDIYNRAYEAVYACLVDCDEKQKISNVLSKP